MGNKYRVDLEWLSSKNQKGQREKSERDIINLYSIFIGLG